MPPLKNRFCSALLLAAGLLTVSARASTYIIAPNGSDTAEGTLESPLATINGASRKVKVGDTVYLRGGTYAWTNQQSLDVKADGVGWVTLSSYPHETAVLDGSKMERGKDMIHANESVKIQYITFTKGRKANLSLWNSRRIRVSYCRFTNSVGPGILIGSNEVNGASDVQIYGCKILDCVQGNSGKVKITRWPPAVQTFQATNISVVACTVGRNFGEGIGFCRTTASNIQGNTVFDNFSVNVYLDNVLDTKVQNNFIYTTQNPRYFRANRAASGISCAAEVIANPTGLARCTIVNNVVTNCFTGFWYSDFGQGGGMKGFRVANNTFYGSSGPLLWIDSDAGHQNNALVNNIFAQRGGAQIVRGSASGFRTDKNCWVGGNAQSFSKSTDVATTPKFKNVSLMSRSGFQLPPSSLLALKKIGYVPAS